MDKIITELEPKKILQAIINLLKKVFSIDTRALIVFRVSLGVLIIWDLLLKLPSFPAFFSDQGFLPRTLLLGQPEGGRISLNFASGDLAFQYFLMLIAFVFAVMLIVGYKTKLSTIVLWVLLISFQNRNPFILHAGDILFRLLFFWAIFLPLEKKPEALSQKSKGFQHPTSSFNLATIAVLLQVTFVFLIAGLTKTGYEWNVSHTAAWDALNITLLVKPLGRFLTNFPQLLNFVTIFVVPFEIMGGALLLSPILTKYLRMLIPPALIFMVLGFSFSLVMDLFPLICATGLILFLPKEFWDFAEKFFAFLVKKLGIKLGKKKSEAGSLKSNDFRLQTSGFKKLHSTFNILYSIVMLILIFILIGWNFGTIPNSGFSLPSELHTVGYKLDLDQNWNMFAPFPAQVHGWYVMPGKLIDGSEVNVLFKDEALSENKSDKLPNKHIGQGWVKFFVDYIRNSNYSYLVKSYAEYTCREWNTNTPIAKMLKSFEIYSFTQQTLPDNKLSEPRKSLLLTQNCI